MNHNGHTLDRPPQGLPELADPDLPAPCRGELWVEGAIHYVGRITCLPMWVVVELDRPRDGVTEIRFPIHVVRSVRVLPEGK